MSAEFAPFDPRGPLEIRRRHLPHWEQSGATYFVTFRLADSLPREVLERLAEQRRLQDAGIPARPTPHDQDPTFAHLDEHLDAGAGSCLLAVPESARLVAACLLHFDDERYVLGAFVVMPNHVHVIVQPRSAVNLTRIVHRWKSYSAHELQRSAGVTGTVWQEERFDRIVRNEEELRRYHGYILANPPKAHLDEGRYLLGHGSARWL